jgi:hypothetical protein
LIVALLIFDGPAVAANFVFKARTGKLSDDLAPGTFNSILKQSGLKE